MTKQLVLLDVAGPVATVTINNPRQRGALTFAIMTTLHRLFDDLARRTEVRAVILASEGSYFCSGHNLREMHIDDPARVRQLFTASAEMMLAMRRMPQPVVSQVHADAAAAGGQVIAGSDLAVAADDARFSGQVIADGKRAFYDMADITNEELAYRHAVLAVVENTLQPDSPEGTRAFLEKRVPVWRHRQG